MQRRKSSPKLMPTTTLTNYDNSATENAFHFLAQILLKFSVTAKLPTFCFVTFMSCIKMASYFDLLVAKIRKCKFIFRNFYAPLITFRYIFVCVYCARDNLRR